MVQVVEFLEQLTVVNLPLQLCAANVPLTSDDRRADMRSS